MNQSEFFCRHCRDVRREFFSKEDLARHLELRHGALSNYGAIVKPPQKPVASGTDFEKVYAVLTWEGDLLEDQIHELRARKQKVDDLALAIQEAGNLTHDGKSRARANKTKPTTPKAEMSSKKNAPQKKPVKKASPKSVEASNVGLSPFKGGTPPPGKPHWDASHSRWMKHPPKTRTPKHEQRPPKSAKRKPARDEDEKPAGKTYEERQYEKEQAEREQLPFNQVDDGVDRADGLVETPLAWVLHNHKAGASARWGQSRANGETDDGMLTRINYELGDQGSWNGPDWSAVWRREKGSTWITIMMEGAEPVRLTGAELIVKVREVLEINAPGKAKKTA